MPDVSALSRRSSYFREVPKVAGRIASRLVQLNSANSRSVARPIDNNLLGGMVILSPSPLDTSLLLVREAEHV